MFLHIVLEISMTGIIGWAKKYVLLFSLAPKKLPPRLDKLDKKK